MSLRGSLSPLKTMVLGSIVFGLLVASCALVLLCTEWGLAHICSGLNRAISSGIAGRLYVERIDELTPTQLRARGVTIFAPDGRPAIEAARAVIDFDPAALLSGRMGWKRAEIEGCHVRVLEQPNGKVNMEETFSSPKPDAGPDDPQKAKDEQTKESDHEVKLALETMVTSRCLLEIGGGSLPTLRMVDLAGIMSVRVLGNGDTELRFDDYRGTFEEGLPTGELVFQDVKGVVQTANKRLLHFDGKGKSEGAPVAFSLDIDTEPETKVKIDARFPTLSGPSLRAFAIGTWSKLSSKLDLNVQHGAPDK